jgi:hypothetical protein
MRALKIVLVFVVALIGLSLPALAQSHRIMGGSAGGSKYQFFYDTFLEPSMPEVTGIGGGTLGGEGVIHRFMSDRRQRVYFGYDIMIEVLPDPNTYRINLSPLTLAPDDIRQLFGRDASSWIQLPTPDWRGQAVRTVRPGEVLALDLLTNNSTSQKIIDYITIQTPSSQPPSKLGPWRRDFIYETGTARNFQTDDAELKLDMEGISVNGNLVPFNGGMSGAAIYFYLPMHGRFVLSLTPHPDLGFRQAGEIRGSTLTFAVNDDTFTIVSSGRIAPGSGPFHLFVLHEPTWMPRSGDTSSTEVGAADRLDQLVGR